MNNPPINNDRYLRGYDDGVDRVLDLILDFIDQSVYLGLEPTYIRAAEEMLESIQNTIDNDYAKR